ncbi:MAG: hypothetical protein NTX30_23210, partial [Deltaproteobacteria bacterium]|nr:hypothetical protein [Deltaproteobacteria bacterium]
VHVLHERPPLPLGRCEKIALGLFHVIPAKAEIQCFQSLANFLDPGFHRGDGVNSIISHLLGTTGDFFSLTSPREVSLMHLIGRVSHLITANLF